jgi:hypothetical protein
MHRRVSALRVVRRDWRTRQGGAVGMEGYRRPIGKDRPAGRMTYISNCRSLPIETLRSPTTWHSGRLLPRHSISLRPATRSGPSLRVQGQDRVVQGEVVSFGPVNWGDLSLNLVYRLHGAPGPLHWMLHLRVVLLTQAGHLLQVEGLC